MRLRFIVALIVSAILVTATLRANQAGEPGDCPNDSKLLNDGPTSVFGDGPGTWWGLIVDAVEAAGFVQVDDQIAYLNTVFGTNFHSLKALKNYNLQLVSDVFDKNQNGYVCAYDLRGTRGYLDPLVRLSYFGVGDDQIK